MRNTRNRATRFGVCINNRSYPVSLEVGKLYPIIEDEEAAEHGYLRVIDESGEDYGYSEKRFIQLEVPNALAKVLSRQLRNQGPQPKQNLRPSRKSSVSP
jgi:hypothetical protein